MPWSLATFDCTFDAGTHAFSAQVRGAFYALKYVEVAPTTSWYGPHTQSVSCASPAVATAVTQATLLRLYALPA